MGLQAKSEQVTVRLAPEDMAFIQRSSTDGQSSAEVVRDLVKSARRRAEFGQSFDAVTLEAADHLAPLKKSLEALILDGQRSALLSHLAEWLPGAIATLSVDAHRAPLSATDLAALEAIATSRVVDLIDRFARLAVTETAPCINPDIIRESAAPLQSLLTLIVADQHGAASPMNPNEGDKA